MSSPRSGHSATLLPNGKVLIAGGMVRNHRFLKTSELFDPVAKKFEPTGDMAVERVGHAAAPLASGRVLIAGGWSPDGPTDTAEIYDAGSGRFERLSQRLTARRARPSATVLPDGRVLLAGGADADRLGSRLKSAEVFDPKTRSFSPVGPMSAGRISHTATLLRDGRVLVAGGRDEQIGVLATSEIFDPKTSRFQRTGSLAHARYKHSAALLSDGRVLVAGGSDERDWRGATKTAEIFDPTTGRWTQAPDMAAPRFKLPEAAARLSTGEVLIAGGAVETELYDPRSNSFLPVAGRIDVARHFMSETLLADGGVLLAGGYPDSDEATSHTWLVRRVR
jgi:WD40 repeat protein